MAKTTFIDGDASLGILGTLVLAAWLNQVFAHDHQGRDEDGSAPQIQPADLSTAVATNLVPPGTIIHTAAATAPAGWLKANGAAVSRTDYAALFAVLGTTYGAGDGASTFNLPDLRGEFLRALDDGRGVDAGRARGTQQADEIKSHNHTSGVYDRLMVVDGTNTSNGLSLDAVNATGAETNLLMSSPIQPAGGSETRPRNVALLCCIKY